MEKNNRDDESCGNCRFYMDRECHRHAPRPKMNAEIVYGEESGVETVWPVLSDGDWCGEWEGG